MVDTTSKWEDELGRWLKPFLDQADDAPVADPML